MPKMINFGKFFENLKLPVKQCYQTSYVDMKCMNIAESRVFSPLFALSVIRQFLHHSHHIFPTAIFFALSWRFCVKKHRACSWGESKGRKGRKRDMGFLCKNHAMLYSKELNNIWKITKNVLHFKNYQKYLTLEKLPKIIWHLKNYQKNLIDEKLPKMSHI